MKTLAELEELLRRFDEARGWQHRQDLRNLAAAIAIEAAELLEHFLWRTDEQIAALDASRRKGVEDELADVIIYCLKFARAAEIDVSAAIVEKMRSNEKRFPSGS